MATFGEYLGKLRAARGLSLRSVATKTGMSYSYLTMIEHGRRNPPGPELMKKLAPVYGVPVTELLKAAGYLDDSDAVKATVNEEVEIDRAFNYAINDPQFEYGTRITGPTTLSVKRFIVELYEKYTGKKLLTGV